jgi:hypothetical protein
MVMARELYTLLMAMPFHLPIKPGNAPIYICPVVTGKPVNNAPLTHTEQATINTRFKRLKHYFMLMQNIEHACFTALNAIVNDAFKVSNMVNGCGWHAGMRVIYILDQLNNTYGKPTSSALEVNDNIFRSPYLTADVLQALFHPIEDCAKVTLLGKNHCTNRQLIYTAVCLLQSTGLYVRTFKGWDLLAEVDQTWTKLCCIIQEAFQQHLNATAPTMGHQGYAPALLYMMNNTFTVLGPTGGDDNDDNSVDTVAIQVAVLTMQSQLTTSTVVNTTQGHDHLYQHLAQQKTLLHAIQHQILDQLVALMINASDVGQSQCSEGSRRGHMPPAFIQPTFPAQGTRRTYNTGFGNRRHGGGRRGGLTVVKPLHCLAAEGYSLPIARS